jgi:hypothetical protein
LKVLTDTTDSKLSIFSSRFTTVATRGLRKSSSLTNGISSARNKTALKEYGTEARGLDLSYDFVHAPILGLPVNGSLKPKGEDIEDPFKVQLRQYRSKIC